MNERLVTMDFVEGEVGVTLGGNFRYFTVPCDLTIVYVTVSPSADDAGLTIDINDDGSGAITGVDASDKDAPGTWVSTHYGGSNDPVTIAADSKVSFDANSAAADTRVFIQIWALTGESYS
jgi:hypothetical protein